MPIVDDLIIQFKQGMREQLQREADKLGVDIGKNVATGTEKHVGALESKLGGMLKRVGAFLAAAFAVNKIIDFAQASVAESVKVEKAWQRVGLALKVTGTELATVRGQLQQAVGDLERVTAFDQEEDILPGFEKLIQLTGDYDTALAALPHVADLAAGANMSFAEAAALVGRGLEGNTRGWNLLNIKLKEGDNLFTAIAERYGGMARGTLTDVERGTLNNARAWEDLNKVVGDVLRTGSAGVEVLAALTQAVRDLTTWVEVNGEHLGRIVKVTAEVTLWLGTHLFKAVARMSDVFKIMFNPIATETVRALATLASAVATVADAVAWANEHVWGKDSAKGHREWAASVRDSAKALDDWAASTEKATRAAQRRLIEGSVFGRGTTAPPNTTTIGGTSPGRPLGIVGADDPERQIAALEDRLNRLNENVKEWAQGVFIESAKYLQREMELRVDSYEKRKEMQDAVVEHHEETGLQIRKVDQDELSAYLEGVDQKTRAEQDRRGWEKKNVEERRAEQREFAEAIMEQTRLYGDLLDSLGEVAAGLGLISDKTADTMDKIVETIEHVGQLVAGIIAGDPKSIIAGGIGLIGDIAGFLPRNKDPGRMESNQKAYDAAIAGDVEALEFLREKAIQGNWATEKARAHAEMLYNRAMTIIAAEQRVQEQQTAAQEEERRRIEAAEQAAEDARRHAEQAREAEERAIEARRRQREYESDNLDMAADAHERYARDERNSLEARKRTYALAIDAAKRADDAHRATLTDGYDLAIQSARDAVEHRERLAEMNEYFAAEAQRVQEERVEAIRRAEEEELRAKEERARKEEAWARERLEAMREAEQEWVEAQDQQSFMDELQQILAEARKVDVGLGVEFANAIRVYQEALARVTKRELGEDSPIWRWQVGQAEDALQDARRRVEEAMRAREQATGETVTPGYTVQRTVTEASSGRMIAELSSQTAQAMIQTGLLRGILDRLGGLGGTTVNVSGGLTVDMISEQLGRATQDAAALQGNAGLPSH